MRGARSCSRQKILPPPLQWDVPAPQWLRLGTHLPSGTILPASCPASATPHPLALHSQKVNSTPSSASPGYHLRRVLDCPFCRESVRVCRYFSLAPIALPSPPRDGQHWKVCSSRKLYGLGYFGLADQCYRHPSPQHQRIDDVPRHPRGLASPSRPISVDSTIVG